MSLELREIPGWEGVYAARSDGQIVSLARAFVRSNGRPQPVRSRVLKPSMCKGYRQVVLTDIRGGRREHWFAHRLVAMCFVPNPENKPHANHKNSIRSDNRVENLEWVTVRENAIHMRKAGRGYKGWIRSTKEWPIALRLRAEGLSIREIGRRLGISHSGLTSRFRALGLRTDLYVSNSKGTP